MNFIRLKAEIIDLSKAKERKQMRELKIDPELKDLLPPLTEEEFKQLEKTFSIMALTETFQLWNDMDI